MKYTQRYQGSPMLDFIRDKFGGAVDIARSHYSAIYSQMLSHAKAGRNLNDYFPCQEENVHDRTIVTMLKLYVEGCTRRYLKQTQTLHEELEDLKESIKRTGEWVEKTLQEHPEFEKHAEGVEMFAWSLPKKEQSTLEQVFARDCKELRYLKSVKEDVESKLKRATLDNFILKPILFEDKREYKQRQCASDGPNRTHRTTLEERDPTNRFNSDRL